MRYIQNRTLLILSIGLQVVSLIAGLQTSDFLHLEQKIDSTPVTINDFSRLNETEIDRLVTPSSYQELQSIVHYAQNNNLKIAISGVRHSQGGHAFYPHAIVISLEKLDQVIDFDANKKLITVQTGATWNQIQQFLHPHGCAVKIMQVANLFTVGGSLSVNCNGTDPSCGPLIESIESIKILLADGSITTASRSKNSELFHLAIGGYGLFGIILEATIQVAQDDLYKREISLVSLPEYVEQLKKIDSNSDIGFHFSFLTLTARRKKLFGKVSSFNFKKLDSANFSKKYTRKKRKLNHEKFIPMQKFGIKLLSKSRLIKAMHWMPERFKYKKIISRNNLLRPPASHLYIETPGETNLLQEYFIPVDNLISFIDSLETITQKLNINLMHVAFRYIKKNTESYLSYTKTDRVGIVLFFNQKMTCKDSENTKKWTQYLIETAAQLNGAYYLPIQLHATQQQALSVYPQLSSFFDLKNQYDPCNLFMNHFYEKYAHISL